MNLAFLIGRYFGSTECHYQTEYAAAISSKEELQRKEGHRPHAKARFIVMQTRAAPKGNPRYTEEAFECYRLRNRQNTVYEDLQDIASVDGSDGHRVTLAKGRILGYISDPGVCERVGMSALLVLAEERLGVCRLADLGIGPSP